MNGFIAYTAALATFGWLIVSEVAPVIAGAASAAAGI